MAEALVDLVDEGATAPTITQIAARAGTSPRTVFDRFGCKEGLMLASVALQSERHRTIVFAIPAKGSTGLRIRALCRQRRMYFEKITPIYRIASRQADTAAGLRLLLSGDRELLRRQLAVTLAPEVWAGEKYSEDLVDALERVTGWDAWRALRDGEGKSAAAAERAMVFSAANLLGSPRAAAVGPGVD